jgi:tetratricopeptide (TPR) repeat protein
MIRGWQWLALILLAVSLLGVPATAPEADGGAVLAVQQQLAEELGRPPEPVAVVERLKQRLLQSYQAGQPQQALVLAEQTLAYAEQTLGPEHPQTLASLNNLAELYQDQDRYREAEPLLQRALAARSRIMGAGHPTTRQSAADLATLYIAQGRYGEAAPLYLRTLTAQKQFLLLLAVLALACGTGAYYLYLYRHPLVSRLSAQPTALLALTPTELPQARKLLARSHRLRSVLTGAGVQPAWLSNAMTLTADDPAARCQALAWRFGRTGRGPDADDPWLWTLPLGETFPLNLEQCLLYLPPADLAPDDLIARLCQRADTLDQVTLLISPNPVHQFELHRQAADPANLWVAPTPAQLTGLLLAADPPAVLAGLIADQVPLIHVSPYQTSRGTNRESIFFGRRQQLAHILNREAANYLIVGSRQIGKSTLLKALERRYRQQPQVHCHYLVLSDAEPSRRLARSLDLPPDTGLDGVLDCLGQQGGERYLFLVDEVDRFIRAERGRDYATLRRFRALSEEGRCHFILAGFWDLYAAAALDYQSPLKNFGETLLLGELEEDACRALASQPMVTMNLRYRSPELVERLVNATGQRANLISSACNEILKNLDLSTRVIETEALEGALDSEAIQADLEGWQIRDDSDPTGNQLDRIIVYTTVEDGEFSQTELLRRLADCGHPASPPQVERALERLQLADVVRREKERYRYGVPLFRERLLRDGLREKRQRELAMIKTD